MLAEYGWSCWKWGNEDLFVIDASFHLCHVRVGVSTLDREKYFLFCSWDFSNVEFDPACSRDQISFQLCVSCPHLSQIEESRIWRRYAMIYWRYRVHWIELRRFNLYWVEPVLGGMHLALKLYIILFKELLHHILEVFLVSIEPDPLRYRRGWIV